MRQVLHRGMKRRILIYGTLKPGECNAHYLTDQDFIGEARTDPRYRMVDCGSYPACFPWMEATSASMVKSGMWMSYAARSLMC
jgi:Gamma-glutamyl cyclotransferase, AIG2-like